MEISEDSRLGNKRAGALDSMLEDRPQSDAILWHGEPSLLFKGERRMKNNNEYNRKWRKGVFGSSSLSLAADHEATHAFERSYQQESSVLDLKEKKRNMEPSKEAAVVSDDVNRKKKRKTDGQATSINHGSQGGIIQVDNVAPVYVEMPSAETGTLEKKYKRKRGHSSHAIDPPSDELLGRKPEFDTMISGKKKTLINNIRKTRKQQAGGSLSEDVRSTKNALPSNDATGVGVCSTPSTNQSLKSKNNQKRGIIQGKRFSKEEDEIIIDAISQYIIQNNLGVDGWHMVLKCKQYPEIKKGCWRKIGASIPWRLYTAVRKRAEKLLLTHRGHKWTPEDIEFIKQNVSVNGNCWKSMADKFGVHWQQVFYAWRRNRNSNFQLGPWTQNEFQQLFDLVNLDLRMRAFEEHNDKHGTLRENIPWQAISNRMGTRVEDHIRLKWYRQLSSSMVRQGLWSETDDYHLMDSLSKAGAFCVDDVDWDNLLANRPGDICLKRWMQMTKHLGGKIERSFTEQLELLSMRYGIELLEYKERTLMKPS